MNKYVFYCPGMAFTRWWTLRPLDPILYLAPSPCPKNRWRQWRPPRLSLKRQKPGRCVFLSKYTYDSSVHSVFLYLILSCHCSRWYRCIVTWSPMKTLLKLMWVCHCLVYMYLGHTIYLKQKYSPKSNVKLTS